MTASSGITEPAETVSLGVDGDAASPLADVGITDLPSFLAFVKKRAPIVVLATLAATTVAAASAFREAPVFATAAKVQLAREPLDPTSAKTAIFYDSGLSSDYVNTEIHLLRSRLLAGLVVSQHLEVAEAFADTGDPVAAVQASTYAKPVPDTRIVELGAESQSPRTAALVANALADTYCKYKVDEYAKATSQGVQALGDQIPKIAEQRRQSQQELDRYIREKGISEHERELVANRLRATYEALTHVQRERIRADSELEGIERARTAGQPIESAPAIAQSQTIQRLRAELATAQIELQQILERYQRDCPLPRVQLARTKVEELQLEINHEIDTIRSSLVSFRDTKLAEEQGLEKLVAQLRDEARSIAERTQRLALLEKDVENSTRLYEELSRRRAELASYVVVENSAAKILDHAREPGAPVRPNRPRTISFGIGLGLLLGLAIAYLLERLDARVRSAADVRRQLGLDVVALIPDVPGSKTPDLERTALRSPESPFAESFRRLRAHVHAVAPARVVLITSGAPEEGKTASAINLAIATANAGERTVLVDADMRNPSAYRVFPDVAVAPGLADALGEDGTDPNELLHATEVPNLYLLTSGKPPRNPAELLARADRFKHVIEQLQKKFDRIVVDAPPAALLSDAALMSPAADTLLLVVSARFSRRRATRLAFSTLVGVGARPLGAIMNHVGDQDLRDLYYEYYRPTPRRSAGS